MFNPIYVGANDDQLFTWVAESSPAFSFTITAVHNKQGLRVEKNRQIPTWICKVPTRRPQLNRNLDAFLPVDNF
jgi:hypothetical protein